MSKSRLFNDMKRETSKLRKHLLPPKFDDLGRYSNAAKIQTLTRSYLILCHAEIETFLEGWAKSIARQSQAVWDSEGKITRPLAFLLGTAKPMSVPENKGLDNAVNGIIVKIYQDFYERVKDNHGVKEKNVRSMFGLLGVPDATYPQMLLPDLDSFGSNRGNHAHKSAMANQVLDPESEFMKMQNLMKHLEVFDRELVKYLRKVR